MWPCRGRFCGSIAAVREFVAALVRELADKVVEASSALSERLAALPVASEGRAMAQLIRLDVFFPGLASELKSVEAYRFCIAPP